MDVDKSFEILGVSSGASVDEVEEAYGDLLDVWDPDRFERNDRLRRKVEAERKRIGLAYATVQAFHFGGQEGQGLEAEQEACPVVEEELEARAGPGPDARGREGTDADDSRGEDWETRTLCADGSCIGVIGGDGRCKECGRTVEEAMGAEETGGAEEPGGSATASRTGAPDGAGSPTETEGLDLDELRQKFDGTRYRDLVQYHIGHQAIEDMQRCIAGAMEQLPAPVLSGLEAAVDEWNEAARDGAFWGTDTPEVFDRVLETARGLFQRHDEPATEEDLFNVFQVFVLTHAVAASENRALRKLAGIRKGLFS